MQKLYCYVDESGQDDRSQYFTVVVIICFGDRDIIRQQLIDIEHITKTYGLKWHKTKHDRRMHYLAVACKSDVGAVTTYYGIHKKPLPYFFPMSDTLERAIKKACTGKYSATVYVDGIDRTIAKKLTNILRSRGVQLNLVKSRRDESEPIIRLADMWAGCIRGMLLGGKESKAIFEHAKAKGHLTDVN
ncbi:DUF3800 domain-containing protein [Candidatus Uhrbacteria bacterium]|nr:DUF3800 domain-containing protein [Candidatus Uhrbacteria bacterium]